VLLDRGLESNVEVPLAAGCQDMKSQPERADARSSGGVFGQWAYGIGNAAFHHVSRFDTGVGVASNARSLIDLHIHDDRFIAGCRSIRPRQNLPRDTARGRRGRSLSECFCCGKLCPITQLSSALPPFAKHSTSARRS
jgi:hypothetical protein